MEHRRSDRRYDRQLAIDFVHEGQTYHARTRNLSLGGVFIETEARLPYGARVQMKFRVVTQGEPIEVVGQVRWCESGDEASGIGVRFDGLRAREVWALNKLFTQPLAGG